MKSTILSTALVLLSMPMLWAQTGKVTNLSLNQCVQTAIEKNINVQNARIEQEKSGYKISETRAALLPKVSISGSFQDNLKLPTTMLPGIIIGEPTDIPVQMGSVYSTTAAATVNQVLFSQTAISALRLSQKAQTLSGLAVEKASEELATEVSKLYFIALTTSEQVKLVNENISRIQHQRDITKLLVDNGMGKKVDYDRINVNLENLYTQLSNTQAAYEQQLNMIKYMLDIPLRDSIVLTGNAESPLVQQVVGEKNDFSEHIDIRMMESQKEINVLNQKVINSGYLPTLAFTGQYMYQGMRNDFGNYFKESPENKWFNSASIGLNLSIPIFDGFEKRSKLRQTQLDHRKTVANIEDTQESFRVNYLNAANNYKNNQNNVTRQKQNIELAENVYAETSLKYREGLASMSDLLQDEMGLSNAQAGYLNALYNFKEAELKIMSLNGQIKSLMKN